MLGLLKRLFSSSQPPMPEHAARGAPLPPLGQVPASPPAPAAAAGVPLVEHPPFALAGAKSAQVGIARCKIGMRVQIEGDAAGGFRFSIESGEVIGKITARHSMATVLASPAVVLHAEVNSASQAPDAAGLLPCPTVRVVTGPAGATWSPPQAEPARSYGAAVAGESFYQAAIRRCRPGDPVRLFHEPDNPHDGKAIAVVSIRGETIGYLPRDSWLRRPLLKEGKPYSAEIESIGRDGKFFGVVLVARLDGRELETRPFQPA